MHRQHIPQSPERHENNRYNSYVNSAYTQERYDDYRGTLELQSTLNGEVD